VWGDGLVYRLLQQGVTVYWAVQPNKSSHHRCKTLCVMAASRTWWVDIYVGPTESLFYPQLTFARISLSARTSDTLVSDQGEFVTQEDTPFERGLDLAGEDSRPPPSGYRRRVLSTVVLLKNLVAPRI